MTFVDHQQIGPAPGDDPQLQAAARRTVLLRYDNGADTAEQSATILAALGLIPTVSGGRFRPDGVRESATTRSERRRAARAREAGDT